MKRSCLLSAFILLVLSILLLSGCSSHSPDEGADEPKVVTLGVWKNDAILPTVNAFNAQQEQFQIRLVIYDSLELMQTELMAGKYCDLYLLEMDNSAMAAKSLFVDFMPRVEETLKNTENEVVPELLDAMTVNGALMQIPYSFSIGTCMGLQQYFDGHGISLEDAKQALNDHAHPIFPEEWKLKARNIASKVSSVSGIFFVDRSKEEVQFQKSEFEEYLKFWMDGWVVQQSQDIDSDLALLIPTFIGDPGEPPAEGYVYTGYPTLENMPAVRIFRLERRSASYPAQKMLTKRGNLSASAYRRSSSGASGKECPSTAACFRNVSTKGSSPRRSQKPTHSVSTNYWTKRNGFALHRKSLISSRRRYLPVLRETGKSRKRRR